MGVHEIAAWYWECDYCGRTKVMQGDDEAPPYHWISAGILAFCSISHQFDWDRDQSKLDN